MKAKRRNTPRRRKAQIQIVDEDDPKGSVMRLADELKRRESQRKKREAHKQKVRLAETTPEVIAWLGRLFYHPVAEALLADRTNFDSEGVPTEGAIQQAIDLMV